MAFYENISRWKRLLASRFESYFLRHLPWQEWDLLQFRFPEVEVAVRVRGKGEIKSFPKATNIRILLLVGDSDGINPELDVLVFCF